jgi:hypothetical protein
MPADGTELTADLSRLRRMLLAVPAIAEFEITPVERRPDWHGPSSGRTPVMPCLSRIGRA